MPRKSNSSIGSASQRQLRVGETVRHAVAEILAQGSVHDGDLEGHIVTVPEVRMSPDLTLATVSVLPLGGRDPDRVIAAPDPTRRVLPGAVPRQLLQSKTRKG